MKYRYTMSFWTSNMFGETSIDTNKEILEASMIEEKRKEMIEKYNVRGALIFTNITKLLNK